MPLYEIYHSFPLTRRDKDDLAKQLTKLHTTTFTTPSLFVNINFIDFDASSSDYYVAGTSRPNSANRITGMVRTSEKRQKADFDKLALGIENVWNMIVRVMDENGGKMDRDGEKKDGKISETENEREAKKLHAVFLYPMVAARESGFQIPNAGEDVQWMKSNMDEFRNRAEAKGDQDFVKLMDEMENREDLKQALK